MYYKYTLSDTNGAIAGAIVGAQLGYSQMMKEKRTRRNMRIILNCDSTTEDYPVLEYYTYHDIDKLINKLLNLFS